MLMALKIILEIQELDMKMIQLMQIKKRRLAELQKIKLNRSSLDERVTQKETEIVELKKLIRLAEGEVNDIQEKIKKLEDQQSSIRKVDEYNVINHEISAADRERLAKEQRLSDMYDKLALEEDTLKSLQEGREESNESSQHIESEINENIKDINAEGRGLKLERDQLVSKADPEVFHVYNRLINNKKDRVIVPLENRCCSGCHIMLTAQHENLVRKGERLIFCEHCSRVHYWTESKVVDDSVVAPKKQRRKRAKA